MGVGDGLWVLGMLAFIAVVVIRLYYREWVNRSFMGDVKKWLRGDAPAKREAVIEGDFAELFESKDDVGGGTLVKEVRKKGQALVCDYYFPQKLLIPDDGTKYYYVPTSRLADVLSYGYFEGKMAGGRVECAFFEEVQHPQGQGNIIIVGRGCDEALQRKASGLSPDEQIELFHKAGIISDIEYNAIKEKRDEARKHADEHGDAGYVCDDAHCRVRQALYGEGASKQ